MRRTDDAAISQPPGIQKPSCGTRRVRRLLSRLVLKPVASRPWTLTPAQDLMRTGMAQLPPGMAQLPPGMAQLPPGMAQLPPGSERRTNQPGLAKTQGGR
jgi:hypothetical protein